MLEQNNKEENTIDGRQEKFKVGLCSYLVIVQP